MAAKDTVKLDWQTIDMDTMPKTLQPAWNAYRKAVEETNAMRDKLQAATTDHLKRAKKIPDGLVPFYSFKWGKMSLAFAEPGTGKTAGAADKFTF